ncbi:indole-3-acetic acid-induced protein ARG2 [Arachis duranensis]|uniref:Indole-3-acetic acid-induced protein ARG2 n=1 Tax=Arachis duranensis TaxID=130453 RepID=A0A6P4CI51_ARADU|nr:indole-3-acetic acid-induced protein ARG2 [Arachis duranensis]
MARSFSTVKASISSLITRQGYATTAQSAVRGGAATISGGKMGPKTTEEKAAAAKKVSWVPDPVTGYYKPENIKDIDVADLRATLLTKKFNH